MEDKGVSIPPKRNSDSAKDRTVKGKAEEILSIRILATGNIDSAKALTALLLGDLGFVDGHALETILSIPYKSIMEMVSKDQIPHHRVGNRVRFRLKEIIQWIDSGKAESLPILTKNQEGKWHL